MPSILFIQILTLFTVDLIAKKWQTK